VERAGGEWGCVISLLLDFSLTWIPGHKGGDTGKSFIKQSAAYSGVKKKFPSVSRV
jgi:hypothetical protein